MFPAGTEQGAWAIVLADVFPNGVVPRVDLFPAKYLDPEIPIPPNRPFEVDIL